MSERDIKGLSFYEMINPHYDSAAPMKLYRRKEIMRRALKIHGGWVGVRSYFNKILKRRILACKNREEGFKMRTAVRKPKVVRDRSCNRKGQETNNSPLLTGTEELVQTDHNQHGGLCA
jgi:hypothetical protein